MPPNITVRSVIVAGGRSTRFGGEIPKQFQALGGRAVAMYSIEAIASLQGVKEICIVLPESALPERFERQLETIASEHPRVVFSRAVGGDRRQDSVARGLGRLSGPCDVVMVHDAARPFPPGEAMSRMIERADEVGGAILATRATDTVKRADEKGLVAKTLDRRELWLAQTPQAFRADLAPRMIELMRGEEEYTDESAVLEAMGVPVKLVEGAPVNFKITRSEDLARAEAMLAEGIEI